MPEALPRPAFKTPEQVATAKAIAAKLRELAHSEQLHMLGNPWGGTEVALVHEWLLTEADIAEE